MQPRAKLVSAFSTWTPAVTVFVQRVMKRVASFATMLHDARERTDARASPSGSHGRSQCESREFSSAPSPTTISSFNADLAFPREDFIPELWRQRHWRGESRSVRSISELRKLIRAASVILNNTCIPDTNPIPRLQTYFTHLNNLENHGDIALESSNIGNFESTRAGRKRRNWRLRVYVIP